MGAAPRITAKQRPVESHGGWGHRNLLATARRHQSTVRDCFFSQNRHHHPAAPITSIFFVFFLSVARSFSPGYHQVVMAMYTCRDDAQRKQINAFMTAFQEHPQAWTRVDTILEATKCDQSKFFVRQKQHLLSTHSLQPWHARCVFF